MGGHKTVRREWDFGQGHAGQVTDSLNGNVENRVQNPKKRGLPGRVFLLIFEENLLKITGYQVPLD
jgi:hypothetical protein